MNTRHPNITPYAPNKIEFLEALSTLEKARDALDELVDTVTPGQYRTFDSQGIEWEFKAEINLKGALRITGRVGISPYPKFEVDKATYTISKLSYTPRDKRRYQMEELWVVVLERNGLSKSDQAVYIDKERAMVVKAQEFFMAHASTLERIKRLTEAHQLAQDGEFDLARAEVRYN